MEHTFFPDRQYNYAIHTAAADVVVKIAHSMSTTTTTTTTKLVVFLKLQNDNNCIEMCSSYGMNRIFMRSSLFLLLSHAHIQLKLSFTSYVLLGIT